MAPPAPPQPQQQPPLLVRRRHNNNNAAGSVVSHIQSHAEKMRTEFPNNVPSLFAGFASGCLLMYLIMRTGGGSSGSTGTADAQKLRSLVITNNNNNNNNEDDGDGWHPIHVFYGDRKGLGADPKQQSYAQVHQDDVVLDLLGTSGYFIDLAANDALELTNTLALERHPGWTGLCIEPNPVYWYGLAHRRCTVVGALMGGNQMERVDVKFRGVYGGIVGKMEEKLANFKKEPQAKVERRYTAPLQQVLERFQVPKIIDYMSLDIEGAEYLVMQHFPFEEYRIRVLTAERPNQDLKRLLESKGYIYLKDLAWWGETLWAHKSTGFHPDHPKIKKIKTEGK